MTADLVRAIVSAELTAIAGEIGEAAYDAGRYELARQVFEQVALADDFADFLTLPAYTAAIEADRAGAG